ncbi:MAG: CRISPR-associated endonuclease Cas3'' [Azospirillaceae bacterium]|nr:CRISPR-associated endonuclease Cas3'' [Azospirillaceae bacterium]
MPRRPIAHTKAGSAETHDLRDHLEGVAGRGRLFADRWGAGEAAALTGLWHDLGKYADDFQTMIGTSANEDAHLEAAESSPRQRVNHSSAGALHACRRFGKRGLALAFVIAGHHAGLADFNEELARRLGDNPENARLLSQGCGNAPPDILGAGTNSAVQRPAEADPSLWIRMLFSAVCDADFLDTEAFMAPARGASRVGWRPISDLLPPFDRWLSQKFWGSEGPVNRLRAEILAACRTAAKSPPGLFSLTVPTGGGKTVSSLAFALEHARENGLRRIIYAVPFTSIIEQTADIFRDALGADAVLEHHSALDPGESRRENSRARLATENWDAPVIVTTTVQLFDSFFANRTSRLRKLHNVAASVIILDEAQSIPTTVLHPVTAVLRELTTTFRATVVLCTATQPALGAVFKELPTPTEIAPDPPALFSRLDRVTIAFPAQGERRSWENIASDMSGEPQALAIVNARADCRILHRLLPPGAIHLSTWQCAAHRAGLLAAIKSQLANKQPVRVVSTSLIEAGVDIDFPVVFRAMAGLDSLAQAAGRCNREGKRVGMGRFVVFRPEGKPLRGHQSQAAAATEAALLHHADAPFRPAAFEAYFRELYWSKGSLDDYEMRKLLGLGVKRTDREWYDIAFRTAAATFKMIDEIQETLIILYDDRASAAIEALRSGGPNREAFRTLQRYTVPIPPDLMRCLRAERVVSDVIEGVTVLDEPKLYDRDGVGLLVENDAGPIGQAMFI